MDLDVLHLLRPTAIIHTKRLTPAVRGNFIEARLRKLQQRTSSGFLKFEFDQSGCFARVVLLGIDRIGVPGEGEEPLVLHLLNNRLPSEVFVPRIGDLAMRNLPWREGAIYFDTEPLTKLLIVRERAPHAGYWCLEFNAFFDTVRVIVHFMQPP